MDPKTFFWVYFPNDGTIFPTTSKKNKSKSSRQKKLAREGAYVPPLPRHFVVKLTLGMRSSDRRGGTCTFSRLPVKSRVISEPSFFDVISLTRVPENS